MRMRVLGRVVTFVAIFVPTAASAAESVLLESDDVELQRALPSALAPLGISVIPKPEAASSGEAHQNEAVETGASTARIWITANPEGRAVLNLRDQKSGRIVERELEHAPPFDSASAASVALMVRAILRSLATPDATPAPPPVPPTAQEEIPRVPTTSRVRVDAGGGVRFDSAARVTPIVAGSIGWYGARLGAAASITASRAANINEQTFVGDLRDDSVALTLRLPLPMGDRLSIEPEAGLSLHWVRLQGALVTATNAEVESQSFNPGVVAGLRVAVALTRHIELAARLEGDGLLNRQQYLTAAETVGEVPRFRAATVLTLSVRYP
jgi:hypothetical protein